MTTGFVGAVPAGASSSLALGLLAPDPVVPVTLATPGVVATPGIDAPDPFVVHARGRYYLFTSQSLFFGPNVPMYVSKAFGRWRTRSADAMPTLPRWAGAGTTWSPDVRFLDGRYVMWFNVDLKGTGFEGPKCIGVATARSVAGPYVSTERKPAMCQWERMGSIDPRTFKGPDGRLWLLWKSDDNANLDADTHSTLFVQRLSADGLRLLGRPTALMTADLPWEGRIVESPDMVYAGGRYWLFFSGNWFNQAAYGVGVAACDGPTGPCVPGSPGPWLGSNAQGSGPGEESLFFDGSRWWMLYAPFAVNYQTFTPRPAALARVAFGVDGPSVIRPRTPAWIAPQSPPSRGPPPLRAEAATTTRHPGGVR